MQSAFKDNVSNETNCTVTIFSPCYNYGSFLTQFIQLVALCLAVQRIKENSNENISVGVIRLDTMCFTYFDNVFLKQEMVSLFLKFLLHHQ